MEREGGFLPLLIRGISAAAKGARAVTKFVSKAQKNKLYKDEVAKQKEKHSAFADTNQKMPKSERQQHAAAYWAANAAESQAAAAAKAREGGGGGGRVRRGQIVKQVMAEEGLSMIEASRYVKQHNLY